MGEFIDLYTSPASPFAGSETGFAEAEYVVIGVPLDQTSSYRPGSRFGPQAIRELSQSIEGFSLRRRRGIDELKIRDAGDLHISGDVEETLRRLKLVTGEILKEGKTPIILGGEHTITAGSAAAIEGRLTILCFDAHLDLRDEYMGRRTCHATVMRRLLEARRPERMIMVGTRAASREELVYAEEGGVSLISSMEISREGPEETSARINRLLSGALYISVDMDVLDPAFAPAVQTPEPEGISTHQLLEIISGIDLRGLTGLDVVEVAPLYDSGATAAAAARIIFEVLTASTGR
ncbi:MAG: agmatinase [Candidatus Bathyarchaeota archaeon B63]|nr:MAG: agmatinase [Candidatus Bathyarchaeota archaeon B63]